MDNRDVPNILHTMPLFSGIAPSELPALLGCLAATQRTYRKGSYLLREGDAATHVGILLSGAAQIEQTDYLGYRSLLAQLTPGDLFAETFACAHVAHIPLSVQATAGCEALWLDYSHVLGSCAKACAFHQRLIDNMLLALSRKNLFLNAKLTVLSRRTTREKLLAYLSAEAKRAGSLTFEIPFNRQELADYLSADRSALSTELSRMQSEGLLTYQKNQFTLAQKPVQ